MKHTTLTEDFMEEHFVPHDVRTFVRELGILGYPFNRLDDIIERSNNRLLRSVITNITLYLNDAWKVETKKDGDLTLRLVNYSKGITERTVYDKNKNAISLVENNAYGKDPLINSYQLEYSESNKLIAIKDVVNDVELLRNVYEGEVLISTEEEHELKKTFIYDVDGVFIKFD